MLDLNAQAGRRARVRGGSVYNFDTKKVHSNGFLTQSHKVTGFTSSPVEPVVFECPWGRLPGPLGKLQFPFQPSYLGRSGTGFHLLGGP